jgi:hypothetical protein
VAEEEVVAAAVAAGEEEAAAALELQGPVPVAEPPGLRLRIPFDRHSQGPRGPEMTIETGLRQSSMLFFFESSVAPFEVFFKRQPKPSEKEVVVLP